MLWSFRGSIVFAVAGIISDVVQGKYFSLESLNSVLVILWAGVVFVNTILPGPKKTRDFYDVLAPDEKHLCVLVADVSGHGIGAAILASMLKIAFASQQDSFSDPGRVLAGMNRALCDKLDSNFVTAACVFLDLESGRLRYAAAGHPPMFLCRKDDPEIREFGDNGLILGPFPNVVFPVTTTALQAGDRVILYTDGVIEARNNSGSFFEDAGFKRFIQDHRSLPPNSFADALLDHLSVWTGKASGKAFADDLTLMILDKT